ncbi:MAG TPA: hypothetical protein VHD84_01210 [Candidatus Saccharimonadales bacterium]|nr:hypothetical protein [Candidatus Saccharimonadales bacterium]
MLLVVHILIALGSIAFSGYTFLDPSETKLRSSYGLVAATLASGTYLVISTHAPLTQACLTGLLYLGIVSAGLLSAHLKLARSRIDS